jgi:glycosyltransferase involved in cell wall biosynthesis
VRRSYRLGGLTRFVSAGAIRDNKGFDLIEEAAAALVARGVVEFQIDIFGDGQVSHYVDMAKRLGVADRVHFLGGRRQSELLQCYKDYDVFLFPTWEQEPFGFAPIEAAACGCVAIITRNCGVSERLVDGVHCLKVDHDLDDLARVMRSVISGEVDLWRIGAAGAALVHTDLSFDHSMDKIEGVLSSACKGWERVTLRDEKLQLLAYVKHHLSRILRFHTES